ncbi:MAG: zinc ABC transporter substrate-binding protein [Bacilli bacterium]|nr:zinc ABC transporter substrate-binding protein [Bacilli bacterium]
MKKLLLIIIITMISILTTACTNDDMEDINITVTNYPNEYITKKLYSKHSNITSIYPDGINIDEYKITKKQKNEYANSDLFIYNGLIEKERDLAVSLLAINPDLKIIDTAYVLETEYSTEELWLDPSSLLMMAQNIRIGLEEYVTSNILKKDIDDQYEKLKVELSELDAEYRVTVDNANNPTIIIGNSALKYLSKFNFKVVSIDSDAKQRALNDVEALLQNKSNSYIYIFEGDKPNDNTKNILAKYPEVKLIELHKINNISDKDRANKKAYNSLMLSNLDLLKKELYE